MLTTVVGSYPVILKNPSSPIEKISDFLGLQDPYKVAINLAVSDQLNAGIDIVSDGQLRAEMVPLFASKIPGMEVEGHLSKIKNKINIPLSSIGADDLKYAKNILNKNLRKLNLPEEDLYKKGIKGLVTGPSTMVYSSRIEGFYNPHEKEEAIMDMAQALKKEAEFLENAGANIIQIDEPFISTGLVDVSTARKGVEIISKDLKVPVALHVCGDVGGVFHQLLKFKVDIIDCEFAGINKNIQLLQSVSDFKGKKIGFGCIDTKKEDVEDVDSIRNLIKQGQDIMGNENMIIDPDCGMRMLSRHSAFSKLKNMVEAAKWQN
ncbi:MAG: methionine synthase [Methanobacterium sp.]|nr:MAG: methionine synthase [Methanobacterium sp.]